MKYWLTGFAAALLTAGCMTQTDTGAANGRVLFNDNCAACHGNKADGNGPLAPKLALWPANLTELSLRNDGIFPADDVIAKVHGYQGADHFADMPSFGSVFTGPTVEWKTADGASIPTTENLILLVKYLETLQVSE